MGRPLAVIGFTYLSALAVALLFGTQQCIYIAVFFLAAFVISLIVKPLRKSAVFPTVFITSAIACCSFYAYSSYSVLPNMALSGQTATVSAELCDLPYEQNGRYYYKLETNKVNYPNSPQNIKILVSSKNAYDIQPYDSIKATVHFYENSDSYNQYNISKGIMLCGSIDSYSKVTITPSDSKPPYYYALITRRYISQVIKDLLPKQQADFVNALVVGDKTGLSYEEKSNFRSAGISHIVAISGFHLSLITQFVMAFLCLITGKRKRLSALLATFFVFAFMAITGFSPSVIRAGIMQIIYLIGLGIIRQADSLNSLGIAALIICFINPYAVADIGFLLSFAATLGIIICSGKITVFLGEHILRKQEKPTHLQAQIRKITQPVIKSVISIIALTVSATVFTLPLTLLYFKQFALYSIISNLLISFAASLLLLSAILMVLFHISFIFSFLSVPFVIISGILTNYILWTADKIASLPFARIATSQSFIPLWLSLMLLLGAFVFLLKNRKRTIRYFALVAAVTFLGGAISDVISKNGSVKLSVLDVGQGLSVVLSKDGETAVLSCGGGNTDTYSLNNYLEDSAVQSIDYMLLMSNKDENSAYAEKVMTAYNVSNIQVYDESKYYERMHYLITQTPDYILSEDGSVNTVYWKNIAVMTYKTDKNIAVYFKINNISFLMCNSGTDCLEIPLQWQKADFLVTDGQLKNTDSLSVKYIIISDSYNNLSNDISQLSTVCSHIYATGGSGHLALRMYSNNQLSVRRENEWLS